MKNRLTINTLLKPNIIIGFLIVLFTILLHNQVSQLPEEIAIYPKIVNITMLSLGIILIITSLLKQSFEEYIPVFSFKAITMTIILLVAYIFLDILGFFTTIGILSLFTNVYATNSWSLKTITKGVLFSVIFTVFLYIIFNSLMTLITPKGIFI